MSAKESSIIKKTYGEKNKIYAPDGQPLLT